MNSAELAEQYSNLSNNCLFGETLDSYITDLNHLSDQNCFNYGAVIQLNLDSRKINRSTPHTIIVYGDNLKNAVEEFLGRDESAGLMVSDLHPDMITMLYQAEF
jgi:hypothetical protein